MNLITEQEDLHNTAFTPEDRVRVELSGGIEPKVESLLSVSDTVHVDVCLDYVRLTGSVT